MQFTTMVRRSLRSIGWLRNRRYQYPALKRHGKGAFLVSPWPPLQLIARNDDLPVVHDIFRARRYATLFPFGRTTTILDIGAHCGYFGIFASINCAPQSRILGFEPEAENLALARENLRLNGITNVQLHPEGVAGVSGTVELYRNPQATAQHSINMAAAGGTACQSTRVEVLGMDDLFQRHCISACDFMKLDCEGAEHAFLFQASDEALRAVTTISMEFHDIPELGLFGSDLAARLAAKGFSIVHFLYAPTRQNRGFGALLATRRW